MLSAKALQYCCTTTAVPFPFSYGSKSRVLRPTVRCSCMLAVMCCDVWCCAILCRIVLVDSSCRIMPTCRPFHTSCFVRVFLPLFFRVFPRFSLYFFTERLFHFTPLSVFYCRNRAKTRTKSTPRVTTSTFLMYWPCQRRRLLVEEDRRLPAEMPSGLGQKETLTLSL